MRQALRNISRKSIAKDKNLKRATRELPTLLDGLANCMFLNIVLDALSDDAHQDDTLREWFSTVDAYIPMFGARLRQSRQSDWPPVLYEKYKEHFDNLFNIGTWFKAFGVILYGFSTFILCFYLSDYRPQRLKDKDGKTQSNKKSPLKKLDESESLSFVVPVTRLHDRSTPTSL